MWRAACRRVPKWSAVSSRRLHLSRRLCDEELKSRKMLADDEYWLKELEVCRQLADSGDVEAMHRFGAFASLASFPSEAFKYWTKASQLGCAKSAHALGMLYSSGLEPSAEKANNTSSNLDEFERVAQEGLAPNTVKAFEYFQLAAERGFALSNHALGICYQQGIGTDIDLLLALQHYERASQARVLDAIHACGQFHEMGWCTKVDAGKASVLYREAAKANHPPSMVSLARLILEEKISSPPSEALTLLESVISMRENDDSLHGKSNTDALAPPPQAPSEQDFNAAVCLLACAYVEGRGVSSTPEKGLELLDDLIQNGYVPAKFAKAELLLFGTNVTKDEKKAVELIRECAEQGHLDSMFFLATSPLAQQSAPPTPLAPPKSLKQSKNFKKVTVEGPPIRKPFEYLTMAADHGHPEAQFLAAKALISGSQFAGKPVVPDSVAGISYLIHSADGGFIEAQFMLAKYYANGHIVEQDPVRAVHYLRLGAAQGDVRAQYRLGLALIAAAETQPQHDRSKAVVEGRQWLSKAAAQGHVEAQMVLFGGKQ